LVLLATQKNKKKTCYTIPMPNVENPLPKENLPISPIEQFQKSIQAFNEDQTLTPEEKAKILKKFDPKLVDKLQSNNLHEGKVGVLTTNRGHMTEEDAASLIDLGMQIRYSPNRIQLGFIDPDNLIKLAQIDTIRYIQPSTRSHPITSK
jgi:hypothetical protein